MDEDVEDYKLKIEEGFRVSDDNFDQDKLENELDEKKSSVEEKQDSPSKYRKKNSNPFKKRIDQLTYENKLKEQQKYELIQKLQEKERLIAEKEELLSKNEQYKNAYYENNLQTREEAIISELKNAKEEGDIDKEVDLQKALAQVKAEQSTYSLYKTQEELRKHNEYKEEKYSDSNYEKYLYPQTPQYSPEEEYESEDYNEAYAEWLSENPWADHNSRYFSHKLRSEIDAFASELNDRLSFNGQSDLIGTPAYFQTLSNVMKDKYYVGDEDDDNSNNTNNNHYNVVAPVNRKGSSMADQYMSRNQNNTRNSTKLTPDEYEIARNLQIRLPNGNYASTQEAIKLYAESKAKLQNSQNPNKIIIS